MGGSSLFMLMPYRQVVGASRQRSLPNLFCLAQRCTRCFPSNCLSRTLRGGTSTPFVSRTAAVETQSMAALTRMRALCCRWRYAYHHDEEADADLLGHSSIAITGDVYGHVRRHGAVRRRRPGRD